MLIYTNITQCYLVAMGRNRVFLAALALVYVGNTFGEKFTRGEVKYVGCYIDKKSRDLSGFEINFKSNNTVDRCVELCKKKGYRFAGLQHGEECFCDSKYGEYGEAKKGDCNKKCTGNKEMTCGGTWKNSIYYTGIGDKFTRGEVKYVGCYIDKKSRDLSGFEKNFKSNNTVDRCVGLCKKKGYRFAGLQHGEECFCDSKYGEYGEAKKGDCNKKCTGNKEMTCGGTWKNSIYYTGVGKQQHLGCFEEKSGEELSEKMKNLGNLARKETCTAFCYSNGYRFAGLKQSSKCFCGNSFDGEKMKNGCKQKCLGDTTQICGGAIGKSIYKTGYTRKFTPGEVQYIGCFIDKKSPRDFPEYKEIFKNTNSIKECTKTCMEQGYKFAGLQSSDQCFCGNNYGEHGQAKESDCNMKCSGDETEICGDTWKNSIYYTGLGRRTYLGCFKDKKERDLSDGFKDFGNEATPGKCRRFCRRNDHKYAGLQYGTQCFCGDSYGEYGIAKNGCTAKCSGDPNQNCGGTYENSVFSTGYAGNLAGNGKVKYIGCFKYSPLSPMISFQTIIAKNSVPACTKKCKDKKYEYAGLQNGRKCLCGNRYTRDGEVKKKNCDKPCPGDPKETCGGDQYSNIYSSGYEAAVYYLGCFSGEGKTQDFSGHVKSFKKTNSKEVCVAECRKKGYKYVGLLQGTKCVCGDSFNKYGKRKNSQCNKKCPGNKQEQCGGEKLLATVYSIGPPDVCKDDLPGCPNMKSLCKAPGIANRCKETCGKCGAQSSCKDKAENCALLAKAEGCYRNPAFMKEKCAHTCDMCFVHKKVRCRCSGDPHCYTFDNQRHDYQGMCMYTIVRDQCCQGVPTNKPNFEIVGDFKRWKPHIATSMMRILHIRYFNNRLGDNGTLQITLSGYGQVLVNGEPKVMPYNKNGLMIISKPPFVQVIDMKMGFVIDHGKGHYFQMKMRSTYGGNICGLCGDFDKEKSNEFTIGPQCMNKDVSKGSVVKDFRVWGHSWRTDDVDYDVDCPSMPFCPKEPPTDECTEQDKQDAIHKCKPISDFMENEADAIACLAKMPEDTKENILEDCHFDFCHMRTDDMVCKALETFAQQCQDDYEVVVQYRSPNLCPAKCEENMRFRKMCGECELNCDGDQVDPSCEVNNPKSCTLGCMCHKGYRRHGQKCVTTEECKELRACKVPGKSDLIPAKAVVMNKACTKRCECKDGGKLECNKHSCGKNAECFQKNCRCAKGYKYNKEGVCKDIDECESKNICRGKGTKCVNEAGSYACVCPKGSYLALSGKCEDIRECENKNICRDNAKCIELSPGYTCKCKDGYSRNATGHCTDVNECKTAWHQCDPETTKCKNEVGSYSCKCKKGYKKDNKNDKNCYDEDECAADQPKKCGLHYSCKNTIGSYKCVCDKDGYHEVGKSCENINECKRIPSPCHEQASCEDTDGSYNCTCKDGYIGDGKKCDPDVPQCDPTTPNNCAENALCLKGAGVSQCKCKSGFEGDGFTNCTDVDECQTKQHDCCKHARCVNTNGGFECKCLKGFHGDGLTCKDINECKNGDHNCDDSVRVCENTIGSFKCNCKKGFKYHKKTNTCKDINECKPGLCGDNSKCVNEVGSYRCECKEGYSGSCENCINDDECALGIHRCHKHAVCKDTQGSYECQCEKGFTGDGIKSCQADKPCKLGVDDCDENSMCVDEGQGQYLCQCFPGYTKAENGTCTNIDECSQLVTGCSPHANCTDTDGSYTCQCDTGYVGDGVICTSGGVVCGQEVCDFNAECINGVCSCAFGYRGKGYLHYGVPGCIDVNECETGEAKCQQNSKCTNLQGTYFCACNEGFVNNGKDECVKERLNPCANKYCGADSVCERAGKKAKCACETGYERFGKLGRCLDKDECELQEHKCPSESKCVNKEGSYTCLCPVGYFYNREDNSCKDVNECYMSEVVCAPEAECLNTPGSYRCRCYDRYSGDGKVCRPIDHPHCVPGLCGDNYYCDGVVGEKAVCLCIRGFAERGAEGQRYCQDVNECEKDNPCSSHANCTNLPGTYECTCKPGYRGNGISCVDVDECADKDACKKSEKCVNEKGSYRCEVETNCFCGAHGKCRKSGKGCKCDTGYTYVGRLPSDRCQDVDECAVQRPCGSQRICTNTDGGYTCLCAIGQWKDEQCVVNACDSGVKCHKHATCSEVDQKPVCTCNDGYLGNGFDCTQVKPPCSETTCSDANATCVLSQQGPVCVCNAGFKNITGVCLDENECEKNQCGDNFKCNNELGSYECSCVTGFTRAGKSCIDVDECTEGTHRCDSKANCTNTSGSYNCTCKEGYVGDGYTCRPDAKCEKTGPCHEHAQCVQEAESDKWVCLCLDGFDGDGLTCYDIPECALEQDNCHPLAKCTEKVGSFECACLPGSYGDGCTCTDIDECTTQNNTCIGLHSVCRNEPLTYKCVCEVGYVMENDVCVDKDECSEENVKKYCRHPGRCTNKEPGYLCSCPSGYKQVPGGCQDVDECKDGTHNCDLSAGKHMECKNTDGGFQCLCQDGYEDEQGLCIDIDECKEANANDCHINANCTNSGGSYTCLCKDGFEGNGKTCIEKEKECETVTCSIEHSECVSSGGTEQCICLPGYAAIGEPLEQCRDTSCTVGSICPSTSVCVPSASGAYCECKAGYTGVGSNCTDINECLEGTPCGSQGTCQNTQGTYKCNCNAGYVFDQGTCVDEDDCLKTDITCPSDQVCQNTKGSYKCVCASGYKMVNGKCVNINECEESKPCDGNATCKDVKGGYSCQCSLGYELNNDVCEDRDECSIEPSICPSGSFCINTAGSYTCTCQPGYKYDGKICKDINECSENSKICGDDSECLNLPGGHQCICKKGYRREDHSCKEINECEEGLSHCHQNANCTNTQGSYECQCNHGHSGDGFICEPLCTEHTCPYKGQVCKISPDGSKAQCRCRCQGADCSVTGTVCATDGMTHSNYRKFEEWKCRTKSYHVQKAYWGKCSNASCEGVRCEQYLECMVSSSGVVCACPECTEADKKSGPICSTLSNTYNSLCALKLQACKYRRDEKKLYDGACIKDCKMGEWGEFGTCDAPCGLGHMTRHRVIVQQPDEGGLKCTETEETTTCEIRPCTGGKCNGYLCERPGAMCATDTIGNPGCICPRSCAQQPKEEVCAQLFERDLSTYRNLCSLRQTACLYDLSFTSHNTSCDELPECRPVPTMEVVTVGKCKSEHKVGLAACEGVCGDKVGECCQPATFTDVEVQVTCPDKSVKVEKVKKVATCSCQPPEKP